MTTNLSLPLNIINKLIYLKSVYNNIPSQICIDKSSTLKTGLLPGSTIQI